MIETPSYPHLNRAPITETMLDIKIRASLEWEETRVGKEMSERLPDYPERQRRSVLQSAVRVEPKRSVKQSVDLSVDGIMALSRDKRQVTQFLRSEFVFSRLEPYENWEAFVAEGLRLWPIYSEVMQVAQVLQVGVRFINRIDFPFENFSWSKYLKSFSIGSEQLLLSPAGFFHSDVFHDRSGKYNVNRSMVAQSSDGSASKIPLILDIAVMTRPDLPIEMEKVTDYLTDLRELKNRVFFGTITDATRGLFT